MKERPILFSAPMVRAILARQKLQTRRIIKPQPPPECSIHYMLGAESWLPEDRQTPLRHDWEVWHGKLYKDRPTRWLCGVHEVRCPYGQPGDRLWVRETWTLLEDAGAARTWDGEIPSARPSTENRQLGHIPVPVYAADGLLPFVTDQMGRPMRWRPSIHMPRWASRITLEVTSVRVERLQDISEEDAMAEGMEEIGSHCFNATDLEQLCGSTAREAFRLLWGHINGAESWSANPWVWVVSWKELEARR